MSTTVGTKGQVTIEKEIRATLGVQPGWRAIQSIEGDQVVIRFRPPKHNRSLLGILGGPDVPALTDDEFREAVDRAWDEAAKTSVAHGDEDGR
jgi:bifunctional DNA-binding transcriptional regulator/antitoxin component of YhaV-PrlF toxin-antitoxin module